MSIGSIVLIGLFLCSEYSSASDTSFITDTMSIKIPCTDAPMFSQEKKDSLNALYTSICRQAENQKTVFSRKLSQSSLEDKNNIIQDAVNYLSNTYIQVLCLFDSTDWGYDGYTEKPGEGSIACGYYITLPLCRLGMHFSLPKNKPSKYVLGQQYPESIIKTLGKADSYKEELTQEELLSYMLKAENGLYIAGAMSSHVGIIIKNNNGIFFRHSMPGVFVLQEKIADAIYLQTILKRLVIAKFDWKHLASCWLKNETIKVVSEKSKYGN